MIVLLSQNYSITLISQDQRGFLLFLMVNQGKQDLVVCFWVMFLRYLEDFCQKTKYH